jgi:hypothetical protein
MRRTIIRSEVTEQLLALGVKPGDVLLTNCMTPPIFRMNYGTRCTALSVLIRSPS